MLSRSVELLGIFQFVGISTSWNLVCAGQAHGDVWSITFFSFLPVCAMLLLPAATGVGGVSGSLVSVCTGKEVGLRHLFACNNALQMGSF